MVYSSSFIYAQERLGDGFAFIRKQLLFSLIGFTALAAATLTDYRFWKRHSIAVLVGAGLLLVVVLIPGVGAKIGGAQRWLRLAGWSFQPAELAKFAVIFFVAQRLARKNDRIEHFAAGVLGNFLFAVPVFVLLLAQPDFGSAAMIVCVVLTMMFLAGVPLRHLLLTLLPVGLVGTYLVIEAPYRMARVTAFIDPWSDPNGKGFQLVQSLLGFHNGNLFGVGLGNGKEKLFFLPEAHNDFIFSVIGEELGFLGTIGVLLMFVFFIHRGVRIGLNSYRHYGDRFGLYLSIGITLLLGGQGLTNMAVVLGMLPTKGLALPFISYGGTSLMLNLFAVGILLSIARGPRRRNES